MSIVTPLIDSVEQVKNDCVSLMQKANEFLKSSDPKIRALGYEISVGVSAMLSEQKIVLNKIKPMIGMKETSLEEAGYGALAE